MIPLKKWLKDIFILILAGLFTTAYAWMLKSVLNWQNEYIGLLLETILCVITSLLFYGLIGKAMRIKEIDYLLKIAKNNVLKS